MIPCAHVCIYAIHRRIRNNVSSFVQKMSRRKDFSMEKPSARGLKMLFNFFQHALVARNTTLAWLLFKARRSKRREKMCESMITRGIMRVGVWKVSKCISAESNGASIFRNVHVRWGSTNATQRMYIHTRTFGIRVVLRFSNGMPFVLFWYPLWIFFFCLGKQEFMVLTMRRVARHDCVFTCIYIYAVVKKRSFRTPLKSLQFKARRADFRFFYVASVKST